MNRKPVKGPPTPAGDTKDIRTVPIRGLVRDPTFQVRDRVDGGTVAKYANVLANGGTMPPIRAALVNSALVVVDGWHRLAAHEMRGITHVEVEVVRATASEAQWMAAAANFTHGLPLRKAEIRTAFKALIRARRHIAGHHRLHSYRELAIMLGGLVRHTTVANWMKQDFPNIARKMADGDPGTASRQAERDDEQGFINTFNAALATAQANAPAVRDPCSRWAMAEAARALLRAVEEGGEVAPGEF